MVYTITSEITLLSLKVDLILFSRGKYELKDANQVALFMHTFLVLANQTLNERNPFKLTLLEIVWNPN